MVSMRPATLGFQASELQVIARRLADAEGASKARSQLMSLPNEEVVTAIITVLAEDPRFADGAARKEAFRLLLLKGAARYRQGVDLFIVGIADEEVQVQCLRGLALAEPDQHDRVLIALGDVLSNEQMPRNAMREALETTRKLCAHDYRRVKPPSQAIGSESDAVARILARALGIFNTSEFDMSVRSAASQLLLSVSDPTTVVPLLFGSDAEGQVGALWALTRLGAETKGKLRVAPEQRGHIRDFVLGAFMSPSVDVRKAAVGAIVGVFGDDAYEVEQQLLIVNPELQQFLKEAANREPNAQVRQYIDATIAGLTQTLHWKNASRSNDPGE